MDLEHLLTLYIMGGTCASCDDRTARPDVDARTAPRPRPHAACAWRILDVPGVCVICARSLPPLIVRPFHEHVCTSIFQIGRLAAQLIQALVDFVGDLPNRGLQGLHALLATDRLF